MLALSLVPGQAPQPKETTISVGVYLPSVFFVGPTEKGTFLTDLEHTLSQAIGQPVAATFLTSPEHIADNHLFVVDAVEAATREGLTVVSRARGLSGTGAGCPSTPAGIGKRRLRCSPRGASSCPAGKSGICSAIGCCWMSRAPRRSQSGRKACATPVRP